MHAYKQLFKKNASLKFALSCAVKCTLVPAYLFVLLCCQFLAAPAMAQIPSPSAGQLLEQVRPPRPFPDAPAIEAPEETVTPPAKDEPRVRIMRLRITGSSVFSEEELLRQVNDAEFKELTLSEIKALAARITKYYRDRGYLLARAYVPAQSAAGGLIELAVIEGRLGTVEVRNADLAGGEALAPLLQLQRGEVARTENLDRVVLLLSDVPGLVVTSTLVPGSLPGTSDLVVDVAKGPALSGSLDVDTNGDRYSGQLRAGGTLNINNPLGVGDQATLRGKVSNEGMHYLSGEYRVPVDRDGTRVGASVSALHYQLGDTLAPLGLEGEARTLGLFVTHPLVRNRRMNVNAGLQLSRISLQDRYNITDTVIDKTVNLLGASLSGDWQDDFSGAGTWSAQIDMGRLHLDDASAALDASGPNAAGQFHKLTFALRRLHGLTPASSLLLSVFGQVAGKNLDASQKMSLGGAYGVRAYPQGEGFGDQGFVATAEWRRVFHMPLPGIWQGSVFVDHGTMQLNKEPWTSNPNTRTLTGSGVGLTVLMAGGWSVTSSLAWRVGSELPVSDSDRSPRGWLQMGKAF